MINYNNFTYLFEKYSLPLTHTYTYTKIQAFLHICVCLCMCARVVKACVCIFMTLAFLWYKVSRNTKKSLRRDWSTWSLQMMKWETQRVLCQIVLLCNKEVIVSTLQPLGVVSKRNSISGGNEIYIKTLIISRYLN